MYAGVWRRYCAALIDSLFFSVIFFIFWFLLLLPESGIIDYEASIYAALYEGKGILHLLTVYVIIPQLFVCLYHALFESSSMQGTLGKSLLGIKVTDLHGRKISFGRASVRYFVKTFISSILCIGYIMAFFTGKKQALHDYAAGTVIIEGSYKKPNVRKNLEEQLLKELDKGVIHTYDDFLKRKAELMKEIGSA